MDMSMLRCFPVSFCLLLGWASGAWGQDEVWLLPAKGEGPAVKRQVEIADLTGDLLSLRTVTGKLELLSTNRVEQLRYTKNTDQQALYRSDGAHTGS